MTRNLVALCFGLAVVGLSLGQDKPSGESIAADLTKSTVFIISPLAPPQAAKLGEVPRLTRFAVGAGVFLGYSQNDKPVILTNYHVVRGGHEVRIIFAGTEGGKAIAGRKQDLSLIQQAYSTGHPISLLSKSVTKDMALLEVDNVGKLPRGTAPLPLAAGSPKPGAVVHAVGCSPAAGLFGYTNGTVRSVGERTFRIVDEPEKPKPRGKNDLSNTVALKAIETSNPINPGDSGGPLVNDLGELVGIAQGKAINATLVTIFVDVTEIKDFVSRHSVNLAARRSRPTTVAKKDEKKEEKPPANENAANTKPGNEKRPSRSFRSPIDEDSPYNRVAGPKAPLGQQPRTRIAFKSGYILRGADGAWTYHAFVDGKQQTGKLKLIKQAADQTLFHDEERKLFYRMTIQGLDRSTDQKVWEKLDADAEWNA